MNQSQPRRRSNAAGFTLVELMVVIAIIAVLATIVGVNVLGAMDDGNKSAAIAQIKEFETALVAYKLKHKKFPDSLDQLVNPPSGEPILKGGKIPDDPWGNPYIYNLESSRKYVITSYGADGAAGGTDEFDKDISSDNLSGTD